MPIVATLNTEKYATRHKKVYDPPNEDLMIKYEQTIPWTYTAASNGETVIIIPELIGAERIVQIEKETKPMFENDFSFNNNTGQITLLNGITIDNEESLFIIYALLVTA